MIKLMLESIFFFQAEDGIRDYKVTGVQTCALPICHEKAREAIAPEAAVRLEVQVADDVVAPAHPQPVGTGLVRDPRIKDADQKGRKRAQRAAKNHVWIPPYDLSHYER